MKFTWIEWSFIFFIFFNIVCAVLIRPKFKQLVLFILGSFALGGIITIGILFQVWVSVSGLSKPAGSWTDDFLYCGKADAPLFYNKFYKCSPQMEVKLSQLNDQQRQLLHLFFNIGVTSNSLAALAIYNKIKTKKETALI